MKFAHSDVLDNGPAYIKSNCNKVILAGAYAPGDSYATVTSNLLAEAAMTSADFTLAGGAAGARVMTIAAKTDTAANAGITDGTSMALVYVDTVNSKVLYATDETSNLGIAAGRPVDFPALTYTVNQPADA